MLTMLYNGNSNRQPKFECQLWSFKLDKEFTILCYMYVNKAQVTFVLFLSFKMHELKTLMLNIYEYFRKKNIQFILEKS